MPPEGKKEPYRAKPLEEDGYAVRDAAPPPRPDPSECLLPARTQVVAADPLPPPPKIAFLSGVFTFPWYLQTLGVWGLISIGLTVSVLGIVLCTWLVDAGLTLAARCFAMPIAWIVLLSAGYTSGSLLAVVQGTSEGYDAIDDWPYGDWREWVWSLRYTALVLVPTLLVAAGVWCLTSFAGSWIPAFAAGFFVYPILLLSALETGSPLALYSRPVLGSLRTLWWGWAIVYAESGLLLAAWAWYVIAEFPWAPFRTVAVAGPLLAAILLIYARLLGRLVWRAQPTDARRRKRRRRARQ
jgi:hypothetical protein